MTILGRIGEALLGAMFAGIAGGVLAIAVGAMAGLDDHAAVHAWAGLWMVWAPVGAVVGLSGSWRNNPRREV